MACGCKKNKDTSRGVTPVAKSNSDLSRYAYLTPRQLRLKQEELEKQNKGNEEE